MQNSKKTNNLHSKVRELNVKSRLAISKTVNFVTVIQNWEIGRMIVKKEQGGKVKAEYGKYIKELSEKLVDEIGRSYGKSNLRRFRQFYLSLPIRATVRHEFKKNEKQYVRKSAAVQHTLANDFEKAILTKSHLLFYIASPHLSWSHYKALITVENPKGKRIIASKYKLFLPTEEELRKELEIQKQQIELEIIYNNEK